MDCDSENLEEKRLEGAPHCTPLSQAPEELSLVPRSPRPTVSFFLMPSMCLPAGMGEWKVFQVSESLP